MPDENGIISGKSRRGLIKKVFRIFFCSLTWIGLSIFILGCLVWILVSIALWSSDNADPTHAMGPMILALLFFSCGALAMLVFGFISRHRYFWIAAITAGTIYIAAAAFSVLTSLEYLIVHDWASFWKESLKILSSCVPGFIGIVLGILFKRFPKAEILKA